MYTYNIFIFKYAATIDQHNIIALILSPILSLKYINLISDHELKEGYMESYTKGYRSLQVK